MLTAVVVRKFNLYYLLFLLLCNMHNDIKLNTCALDEKIPRASSALAMAGTAAVTDSGEMLAEWRFFFPHSHSCFSCSTVLSRNGSDCVSM